MTREDPKQNSGDENESSQPDSRPDDQNENLIPSGSPENSNDKWEVLLSATPLDEEPSGQNQDVPFQPNSWTPWIRASIPVLILVFYAGYKLFDFDRNPENEIIFKADEALTNSKPPEDTEKLNREEKRALEELIGDLDYLQQTRSWQELKDRTERAPAGLKNKPEVQLFELLARSHLGERNRDLRDRVRKLRPYFQDSGSKGFLQRLDYLEAKILTDLSITENTFLQNSPRISALLSSQEFLTDDILRLRMRLSQRYEELGDREYESSGAFRRDQVDLSNARSYFQQAMRWVVTKEGWLRLEPIDRGEATRAVERIRVKLKDANSRFHGPALPFTGADSETWSGKQGDPVHDRPGGTW